MRSKHNGLGRPLSPETQERLSELIASIGEAAAARELEVCRATLGRALAGLGVRRGTATYIEVRLAAVEALRRARRC